MPCFKASTAIADELNKQGSEAKEKLFSQGWQIHTMRKDSISGRDEAIVFTRKIHIHEKYPEYFARNFSAITLATSHNEINNPDNISNNKLSDTGSDPTVVYVDDNDTNNHIYSLQDLPSVSAMCDNINSIVLAFDTEFVQLNDNERLVLSYQFAFFNPKDYNIIHEVIFIPVSDNRLLFERIFSWILTQFNLCPAYKFTDARRWRATLKSGKTKLFTSPELAYNNSIIDTEKALLAKQFVNGGKPFKSNNPSDGGYVFDTHDFTHVNFTLISHFAQADLSTFLWGKQSYEPDLIAKCSNIQGGLVTLRPSFETFKAYQNPKCFYPVKLSVRDSKCFAPAGKRSLKHLGAAISLPKIELPYGAIEHMDDFFKDDPILFFDYAITDSVICLLYSAQLWGFNMSMPVTITSGAARVAVSIIKNYFGAINNEQFNSLYRGIREKTCGKELYSNSHGRRFHVKKHMDSISDDAFLIMNMAANAYAGGFNACLGAEYVNAPTHDYDLQNAYPTAMSCISDPDWTSNNLIVETIEKRPLTLNDFHSPCDLMFGDIQFEFPKDVLFPCIPVNVDGCLIFPRTSHNLHKCYASGPELYLALRLGATVTARRVYIASHKIMPDGTHSQCLYKVAKQFVLDRQLAKDFWGKKSSEQEFLKTTINSIYGKTAQSIKKKSSWNAYSEMMDEIGCSALTSPVHACLITSLTRCLLIAAMNQLSISGYNCYSVTTDGFISNAPFETLDNLDLFGFSDRFREARIRLTGSPDMWEEKHSQSSFLNFSTRGNISLDQNGVCAHNGLNITYSHKLDNGDEEKIPVEKGSSIDRYLTMAAVALRNEPVHSKETHFTGFKELSYHSSCAMKRKDFTSTERERLLRMDFDMKRKPLEPSFKQVFFTIRGVTGEIIISGKPENITLPDIPLCEWVNFSSVPYESVEEYQIFRKVYNGSKCLRTKAEWDKFWLKIHSLYSRINTRLHIRNNEWAILISVIRGYRLGIWDIPALSDKNKSVKDKINWINNFNKTDKPFSEADWKNCARKDRAKQMLAVEDCKNLLETMQACPN